MSCNVIVDNLIVGDYEVAKNLPLLQHLGVTHIVACGFDKGYFHSLRKFHYFCIDLIDSPSSNLLQYLPRTVKFIEKAIFDHNGIVYVHCVHGQSRSCAVCVAYLMAQVIQSQRLDILNSHDHDIGSDQICNNNRKKMTMRSSLSSLHDEGKNCKNETTVLHLCYNKVLTRRTQMAINPGFVKQLDIFRQMKCYIHQKSVTNSSNARKVKMEPILSKPHAYFRSFRAKTQFQDIGNVKSQFYPLIVNEGDEGVGNDIYHCHNCRMPLFTEMNIIYDWTEDEEGTASLPVSDYWKDSQGGIDYYDSIMNHQSSKKNKKSTINRHFEEELKRIPNEIYKVEPIEWMKQYILIEDSYVSNGNLVCYKCSNQIGYWDWLNTFDVPTAILIKKSKVFVR